MALHHVERSRQRRSSRARAARAHRVRAHLQHLRAQARRRRRRRAGASPRGPRPLDIHGGRAFFSFRVPPVGLASSPRARRLTPTSPPFPSAGLHPRGEDVRRRRGECAREPRRRAANDATDPTTPSPLFHPPSLTAPLPAPRPQTKGRTVVFGTACAAVVLIGGYIPVYACQFQQRKAGA